MLPHDKLDWNIRRLETRIASDSTLEDRLALARACLSRGRFHGGGGSWYHKALTHARRALHREPEHPEATVLAALALVLSDRIDPALRHLEAASELAATHPLRHFALGELALVEGDPEGAREAFAEVTRLAPDSWEAHHALGRLLAQEAVAPGASRRAMERAQYHLVRALQLGPSHELEPGLLSDLAMLCMRTDRVADAERLLHRLLDFPAWQARAHYHLGRVAARTGRHKRAIWCFRTYLEAQSDQPVDVWTRIAASNLALDQHARARDACGRALAVEPRDIHARQVLGAALLALDLQDEAARVFREILEIAPEHDEAFAQLVRMRTANEDVGWLRTALRTEVGVYDRLPLHGRRRDPRTGATVEIDPRDATRARIRALIRGLGRLDPDVTHTVLSCLDLTTDEGLRFALWEGVLELLARQRAEEVHTDLVRPGEAYGTAAGRDVLSLATLLDEDALVHGLAVEEEDLRRAAVDRHGPSDDVNAFRACIDAERHEARAWQGLLLLAIASHRTPSARNLLVRWSSDADAELATAARAGLIMCGDAEVTEALRTEAAGLQLDHLVDMARESSRTREGPEPARLVSNRDDLTCATCGRRGSQVAHMMHGHGVSICSVCLSTIHERRDELRTRDPDIACALTGATLLDADALYVYQGVPVARAVVDESMGHDERETVAAYLASL